MSRGHAAYGGRAPEVLGVAWSLFAITTMVTGLRIYSRCLTAKIRSLSKVSWALGWAILAWVLGVLGSSFLSVASHYGYGNHIGLVNAHGDLERVILFTWVWALFSSLMVVAARLSVVAFYIDVHKSMHVYQRWLLVSSISVSLVFNLVAELLRWFQCNPPRKIFDITAPRTCPYEEVSHYFAVFAWSWGALVDLCLAAYPIYVVYRLAVSRSLKVGVGLLVALGVFTAVCSCMKAYELGVVRRSEDRTYDYVPLALWTIAECWLVLLVSGIPETWSLLLRMVGDNSYSLGGVRLFNSTGNDSQDGIRKRSSQASTLNDNEANQIEEGKISVMREVTVKRYERHNWEPRLEPSGMKTWGGNF